MTETKSSSKSRFKKAASSVILGTRVLRYMSIKKVNLKFPNGDHYSGDMDMGKARFHGTGTFRWANGARYEGEWFNGKRHGQGKLYDRPRGENDQPSGDAGRQSVYVGAFKNNKREGQGRYDRWDGAVYEGEWKKGRREGNGSALYVNGEKYQGRWKNNVYHGIGIFRWNNGKWRKGEWAMGSRIRWLTNDRIGNMP